MLTNILLIAFLIALAAIAFIGIDAYLGSDIVYIAGREFLSFLEWLAFWR
jgi:hypothetical protein